MTSKTYESVAGGLHQMDFSVPGGMEFLANLDRKTLSAILSDVLSDASLLRQLACRSYIHQLGFHKYIIKIVPETGAWLRLHYWPHQVSNEDEDIHDHCASFVSRIMQGELTHKYYKISPGRNCSEYRYCFNETTQEGHDLLCGYVSVVETQSLTTTADTIYFLDKDILHKVSAARQNTITLSLWERRTKEARIIRCAQREGEKGSTRAGMTSENAYHYLSEIIALLSDRT